MLFTGISYPWYWRAVSSWWCLDLRGAQSLEHCWLGSLCLAPPSRNYPPILWDASSSSAFLWPSTSCCSWNRSPYFACFISLNWHLVQGVPCLVPLAVRNRLLAFCDPTLSVVVEGGRTSGLVSISYWCVRCLQAASRNEAENLLHLVLAHQHDAGSREPLS